MGHFVTGDKQETAIDRGCSCKLLHPANDCIMREGGWFQNDVGGGKEVERFIRYCTFGGN